MRSSVRTIVGVAGHHHRRTMYVYRVRRFAWLVLGIFAILAVLAGARHVEEQHPVDAKALAVACEELSTCLSDGFSLEATPFQRRYVIEADRGTVIVTCRWPWLLWGTPSCEGHAQRRISTEPITRLPHEVPRGAPQRSPAPTAR